MDVQDFEEVKIAIGAEDVNLPLGMIMESALVKEVVEEKLATDASRHPIEVREAIVLGVMEVMDVQEMVDVVDVVDNQLSWVICLRRGVERCRDLRMRVTEVF